MKVNCVLYLDDRKQKKNGKFPVKVRITCNRVQKYFTTGLDLDKEEWGKINGERVSVKYQEVKGSLSAIHAKANNIIGELGENFSFERFEDRFYKKRLTKGSIDCLFQEYIDDLVKKGQMRTSVSYRTALASLKLYKPSLTIRDITPSFLHLYEQWMEGNGKSRTTVGIYLRSVRAIFNYAISKGDIHPDDYPFGRRKYVIPAGKNVKKAIDKDDIIKILNYPSLPNTTEQKAKDLWMFSYLCNGINMNDIARLKFENWVGNEIVYYRSKTANTTKSNPQAIRISLLPQTLDILQRLANRDRSGSNYIFPILSKGLNPEQEYKIVQQLTKTVNKYLKKIANKVGIEGKVTTYTARHSFSTVLLRENASVAYISQSLGHTNIKTTQNYLGSFAYETRRHFAEKLL